MALKEIEECRICLPPAAAPRPPLPLTYFDIFWQKPVERLFFFRFPHSTTDFLETNFPNLKSSLVLTLNIFYPLAGAIRRSLDLVNRLEIRYSDGDSVPFAVYEYAHADFDDISGHHKRPFEKLKSLVPKLPKIPEAQPLLAVQVTLFPNQGLCLGLSIHHAACDGFSALHFLKSWAALSHKTSSSPPPPPSFDRSFISDPLDLYTKRANIIRKTASLPNPPKSLTSATFTLSSSQIQILKQRLQSKVPEDGKPPFHISTFVVSTACAWICLIKSKGQEYDGLDRAVHLIFAVNSRNRMHPRPPEYYFGNLLGSPCIVKATVAEIVGKKKDGIFRACEIIGKAIDEIEDDVYEGLAGFPKKIAEMAPYKPVSISGSPKLRVYEVDFGWGTPRKVEVTSNAEAGAISMAESRDDGGGIEIGIVLPEDEIHEFGKHFNKFQQGFEEEEE